MIFSLGMRIEGVCDSHLITSNDNTLTNVQVHNDFPTSCVGIILGGK